MLGENTPLFLSTVGGVYVDFPEIDGYIMSAKLFNICKIFFGYPFVDTSQFIIFSIYLVYTSSLNGSPTYLIVFLSNNSVIYDIAGSL